MSIDAAYDDWCEAFKTGNQNKRNIPGKACLI